MSLEVIDLPGLTVETLDSEAARDLVDVIAGPPGPRGPAGAGAVVVEVPIPQGTWSIPHDLGRLPAVQLIVDGHPIDAPMSVSATQVVVTWPYPVAGTAILI